MLFGVGSSSGDRNTSSSPLSDSGIPITHSMVRFYSLLSHILKDHFVAGHWEWAKIVNFSSFLHLLIGETFLYAMVAVPGRYPHGNPLKIRFQKTNVRAKIFCFLSRTVSCQREREREREREA